MYLAQVNIAPTTPVQINSKVLLHTYNSSSAGARNIVVDETSGYLLVGLFARAPNLNRVVKCQIFSNGSQASVVSKYMLSGAYQSLAVGVIDPQNRYSYWYV